MGGYRERGIYAGVERQKGDRNREGGYTHTYKYVYCIYKEKERERDKSSQKQFTWKWKMEIFSYWIKQADRKDVQA